MSVGLPAIKPCCLVDNNALLLIKTELIVDEFFKDFTKALAQIYWPIAACEVTLTLVLVKRNDNSLFPYIRINTLMKGVLIYYG